MQEICAEAGMSPGNLYRYFPSKEALIAGISERNRADAAAELCRGGAGAGFFDGLAELARHHLVDRSETEVGLCAEIMTESRRNPAIAQLYQDIERDIKERIAAMLRLAVERGEIRAELDVDAAASVLMVLGDGMSWRRAVDADFRRRARAADDPQDGSLPARQARRQQTGGGRTMMKASRITAIGLVAAAAIWIVSGHLLPRDSSDSRAAIRPAEQKTQPRIPRLGHKRASTSTARCCRSPAAPRPTRRS